MPSVLPPELPRWKHPANTKAKLDWANISIIDISSFEEAGGKEKLAEELRSAVSSRQVLVIYSKHRDVGPNDRLL